MWQHDIVPVSSFVLPGLAVLLLVLASLRDIATRTVPNGIPLALAAIGIADSALQGRLVLGLIAGVLVFGFAFLCWRMRWIGGADVKLLGAAALLVPPTSVASLVLATAVAGGLLGLVYLLARRLIAAPTSRGTGARDVGLLARVWRAERWRLHRGCPLPYACAIACGTFLMLR